MQLPHYQYFLALEHDFIESIRFAELHPNNSETFSTSYLKMLFSACIEIETVLKLLSQRDGDATIPRNIDQMRQRVLTVYPAFARLEVLVPRYSLNLSPWLSWDSRTNPDWWHAYTATKHNRQTSYELANQKNVLEAIAGLFACLIFLYAADVPRISLDVEPNLFYYESLFPQHIVYGSELNLPQ